MRIKHAFNSLKDGNKYQVRIWKSPSFQIKYGKSNNWVNFGISHWDNPNHVKMRKMARVHSFILRSYYVHQHIFGLWLNTGWYVLVYYDSIQRNYHDYDGEIYSSLMNSLSSNLYLTALKRWIGIWRYRCKSDIENTHYFTKLRFTKV